MTLIKDSLEDIMKIEGFNNKEQKIYDMLLDGEQHDFRDLKKLFAKEARAHVNEVYEDWDDSTVDSQAQSYARNSVRRLIRDGWVEGPAQNDKLPRGTYRMSKLGKEKIKRGTAKTVSADSRKKKRTKKDPAKKAAAKKAPTVKAAAKKAPAKKAAAKKASAKKAPAKKAASKGKSNGAKSKSPTALEKAQQAKQRAGKEVARDKAVEAARRAASASASAN